MACYTIPPHESAELWHAIRCWDVEATSVLEQDQPIKGLRRCGGRFLMREGALYVLLKTAMPIYGKRLFKVEVKKISPVEYSEGDVSLLYDKNRAPYNFCHTYNEIKVDDGGRQRTLYVVDVHHDTFKRPHEVVYAVVRAVSRKIKKFVV
jgi:hypothetical protein